MLSGKIIHETRKDKGEARMLLAGRVGFSFVDAQLPTPGSDFPTQVRECLGKLERRAHAIDESRPEWIAHVAVQLIMPTTEDELHERREQFRTIWDRWFEGKFKPLRTVSFVAALLEPGCLVQMTPTIIS